MNALLSYLLTLILTAHALNAMKSETIKFSQLPGECAAEYDSFLRKERKADSTKAIIYDLNGTGSMKC